MSRPDRRAVPTATVGLSQEVAAKRRTGVVQAGLLTREIRSSGCRCPSDLTGGRPRRRRRYREPLGDPARAENLGMHESLHAREPGGPVVVRAC
jgi:hypothetical protein